MVVLFSLFAFWGFLRVALGATPHLSTFAGVNSHGTFYGSGIAATSSFINSPHGVAVNSNGDLIVADLYNYRVHKVSNATGILVTIAGTGSQSSTGDGSAATSATLNKPHGVFVDTVDDIYIVDQGAHKIRKVTTATGIISTVAGTGSSGWDGKSTFPATSAKLNNPSGVWVNTVGDIYIADTLNNRIRLVTKATGNITTVVGGGSTSSFNNTAATSALLSSPNAVFGDSMGYIYFSDNNAFISKVSPWTKKIYNLVGTWSTGFNGDNLPGTSTTIYPAYGLFVEKNGDIVFSERDPGRVRKYIAVTKRVKMIVGTNKSASSYNGDNQLGTKATLAYPYGVCKSWNDDVIIADSSNYRVRKVSATTGIISTIASTGSVRFAGDGYAATSAWFFGPYAVWTDSNAVVFIVDTNNYRIRKVDTSNIISTYAGAGFNAKPKDNYPALLSPFGNSYGITGDSVGNIYFSDSDFSYVLKIDNSTSGSTRKMHYFAGNGALALTKDNIAATSGTVGSPFGLFLDTNNVLYIADNKYHCIRQVKNGVISRIMGTGIYPSYYDYNGDPQKALFNFPFSIFMNSVGDVYINDQSNSVIRKYTKTTGKLTVFAGVPVSSKSGYYAVEGPQATTTKLSSNLYGLFGDSSGNIYIGDNNIVRKVDIHGNMTVVMGGGSSTLAKAPATSVSLGVVVGIWVDTAGTLYVGDTDNYVIRRLAYAAKNCTIIAGSYGNSGTTNGASATASTIGAVYGLWGDSQNKYLFMVDYDNGEIRKLSFGATNTMTTLKSGLSDVEQIWGDTAGYLYVSQAGINGVYKILVSTGIMTRVAGNGGDAAFGGDGKSALKANMSSPYGITGDTAGNLYVVDSGNYRVRYIAKSTGIISTFAGIGEVTMGTIGEGIPATSCQLNAPKGIWGDSNGYLYVADTSNHAIRKYDPVSTNLTTILGTKGTSGGYTTSNLKNPTGVVGDTLGALYIADYGNNIVRKLSANGTLSRYAGTGSATYTNSGIASSVSIYGPTGLSIHNNALFITTPDGNTVETVSSTTSTPAPTFSPSAFPTQTPTFPPTASPTQVPTYSPTAFPTQTPTFSPTAFPTEIPTFSPTVSPTASPTQTPTFPPTASPTETPTFSPTASPTAPPTQVPTYSPTASPTETPTFSPTVSPTASPTETPTFSPTASPTQTPTMIPSFVPSEFPSSRPTLVPTVLSSALTGSLTVEMVLTSVQSSGLDAQSSAAVKATFYATCGIEAGCIASVSVVLKDISGSAMDIVTKVEVGASCALTQQLGSVDKVLSTMKNSLQTALESGNFTVALKQQAAVYQASSLASVSVSSYSMTKQSTESGGGSSDDKVLSDGEIAGVVIVGVLAVIALVGLCLVCCRGEQLVVLCCDKKKKKHHRSKETYQECGGVDVETNDAAVEMIVGKELAV